jgi:tRNA1(Val) A37 N6-methylase TrmN6
MALQDLGQLDVWLAVGLGRVRSGGTFTAILRADRLAEALTALPAGGLTIFPMWPRNDRPAKRVIVQVRKNSRAPLVLRRGLVLHEGDGRYTTEADEILRAAGSLALAG